MLDARHFAEQSFEPMPALAVHDFCKPAPMPKTRQASYQKTGAFLTQEQISETLQLLSDHVGVQRRLVRAGDALYRTGEAFEHLFVANAGFYKVINVAADGREQMVGVKFRGDWLGLDGMARGAYSGDAIAMDTGEVWVLRYDKLLEVGLKERRLLMALHQALAREIAHDRDILLSVCTLPAAARVADFLLSWAQASAHCGYRADQVSLRMTRAEIGNYLGLTLESVSRALSKLARHGLIVFSPGGRRDVSIPNPAELEAFVQRSAMLDSTLQ